MRRQKEAKRFRRAIVGSCLVLSSLRTKEDKSAPKIQAIVYSAPYADYYCTYGYLGYLKVIYPGKHIVFDLNTDSLK